GLRSAHQRLGVRQSSLHLTRILGVAQIFNLLYRRFAIGRAPRARARRFVTDGWQNAILRYSRLKICATSASRNACKVQNPPALWIPWQAAPNRRTCPRDSSTAAAQSIIGDDGQGN